MNEIKTLESQIEYHNHKYWVENKPEISDIEYDELVKKLLKLDPTNNAPYLIPATNLSGPKIKHQIAMLSLDKCYSIDDLIKWMNKVSRSDNEEFTFEPKYDGIAAKYCRGILSTRGNGVIGENISDKKDIINFLGYDGENINNTRILKHTEFSSIRKDADYGCGELIIFKDVFKQHQEKLIRKDGSVYKLPRSAVYGIISLKEDFEKYARLITFVQYGSMMSTLKLKEVTIPRLENIKEGMISCQYPIDGVVIKLKDEEYSHSLGYTSHHPKGQIALKLGNPTGETILKDIIWSSGKGCLTPVGIIEPVIIENTTNTKIGLHNLKYIIDNDIVIGDKIIIEKCGEIIPQYKSTIEKVEIREFQNLIKCPVCDSYVKYVEPNIVCTNINCTGMLSKKLEDSLRRLGIEHIGESTINKLIDIGMINVYDILTISREKVSTLPGFKEKSIDNFLNQINSIKSKAIEDWRILSSLNIPTIGKRISQIILKNYTLDEVIELNNEDLKNIESIGPKRASLLNIELQKYKSSINQLKSLFQRIIASKNKKTNKQIICFTGKCPEYSRTKLQQIAIKKGYDTNSIVNKQTSILVTNDINKSSNKIKNAKKYNTEIITYDEFFRRISK